ncbi:hypothetical protein SAMN05421856_11269 [Chryseobacterium taichungense]|uniref:Uncharacterized protein n=1 Tax=Chryseobacterium taichungense TaxID=295069 RepID=A0A1H8DBJ9_9FLAO|nr:hypothetical protein [Chryseobacterium taichungense]SEN04184.1 hypothetical protein SAMN05421856_11269 [Chryseobacterium taichungense]
MIHNKYALLLKLRNLVRNTNAFDIFDFRHKINDFAYWSKGNDDFVNIHPSVIFSIRSEQQLKIDPTNEDFDVLVYSENQTSYEKVVYKINDEEFLRIINYIDSLENR